MNPFFTEYDTPYQIPPFKKIKDEHYMPAFNQGMKEQLEEIASITNNLESPSFENTIVELERTGKTLDKVSNVFFNLNSSNTNDQMDAIAKEISPKIFLKTCFARFIVISSLRSDESANSFTKAPSMARISPLIAEAINSMTS